MYNAYLYYSIFIGKTAAECTGSFFSEGLSYIHATKIIGKFQIVVSKNSENEKVTAIAYLKKAFKYMVFIFCLFLTSRLPGFEEFGLP